MTNVFIAALACPADVQSLIRSGAAFQSLIASLMHVFWVSVVLPISQGLFAISALVWAPQPNTGIQGLANIDRVPSFYTLV